MLNAEMQPTCDKSQERSNEASNVYPPRRDLHFKGGFQHTICDTGILGYPSIQTDRHISLGAKGSASAYLLPFHSQVKVNAERLAFLSIPGTQISSLSYT